MTSSAESVSEIAALLGASPIAGLSQPRDRISVARWRHNEPFAENGELSEHILILAFTDLRQRRRLTETQDASVSAGSLGLTPAGPTGEWEFESPVDCLHVYLSNPFLHFCMSQHGLVGSAIELRGAIGFEDSFLREALCDLDRALSMGKAARLFASTLGMAVGLRVLTHHSNVDLAPRRDHKGGLSHAKLRLAIEFMHAHLTEDVTLDDVASVTGLSAFHFARAFKQATGLPPHRWLVNQRIVRARELLTRNELALASIALECGFAHQSHFTTAFKKALGITPAAFRRAVSAKDDSART